MFCGGSSLDFTYGSSGVIPKCCACVGTDGFPTGGSEPRTVLSSTVQGKKTPLLTAYPFALSECRVFAWSPVTLRWRRWSDIRTHLLGNRPELQGFLSRCDDFLPSSIYRDDAPCSVASGRRCLVVRCLERGGARVECWVLHVRCGVPLLCMAWRDVAGSLDVSSTEVLVP